MEIARICTVSSTIDAKYIDKGVIELKVNPTAEEMEKILAICHRQKHLFLDGYPHGHRNRQRLAKAGIIYERWDDTPRICLTYTFSKNDKGNLIINVMPGNRSDVANRFAEKELGYFLQLWQQNVADEIATI